MSDETLHDRHFTVDEAEAELPALRRLLQKLRGAKDMLTDAEAHQALATAAPTNGGGQHGTQVGESFLEVRRLLGQLAELGIVVRDIDRGLVDFPSFREGREIYLCWHLGEERIDSWHEVDSGFADRRPL